MKPLTMPIQRSREEKEMGCPASIPFANIDTSEMRKQALENHDQTLERLAERGGMAPLEMYAIAHGLRWREVERIPNTTAVQWLIQVASPNEEGGKK